MSKGVRFTFAFCQEATTAITHIVNDLMSFPFGGVDTNQVLYIQWGGEATDDTMETYNGDQQLPSGLSSTLSSSSPSSPTSPSPPAAPSSPATSS